MHIHKRRGEVAQVAFEQRAMAEGLCVARTYSESYPFDCLAGTGIRLWRMQIKSSAVLLPNGMYHVNLGHDSRTGDYRRSKPYTADEIDAFGILIIPESRWYIAPVEVIDGRVAVNIHSQQHMKMGPWLPYLENWSLLRQTGERMVLPDPEPNCPSPGRKRPAIRPPFRRTVDRVLIDRTSSLLDRLGKIGNVLAPDDSRGIQRYQSLCDIITEKLGDHRPGDGKDGRPPLDIVGVGGDDVDGTVLKK